MRVFLTAILVFAFGWSHAVGAAMNSTNYQISFDSINSGGTDFSSSTNYQMHDTVGEQATGYGTSTNYELHAGYRQVDKEQSTLAFQIGAQENDTRIGWTAISTTTPQTVTVTSTIGYTTGSFIGVVENEGLGQIFVVGKITQINGLVITVDKWDGMTSQISATPSGSDDMAYKMDEHGVAFGEMTVGIGKAGIVITDISTNATNGYTLRIESEGGLTMGSGTILNVSDGTVTAGQEEYGARVYGTSATGTGSDFSVSTTQRAIQESSGNAENDRIGMIYKLSIGPGTPAGSYTQTVRYLLTANF